MEQVSVLINGGGMVGAAAALAFAKEGADVTLLEPKPPAIQGADAQPDWDLRISSVNNSHWEWLLSLGVGEFIRSQRVFDYDQLSVTAPGAHQLSFHASEVACERLGVMVENNALQQALWTQLRTHNNVSIRLRETLTELDCSARTAVTSQGDALNFDLLLGCDGAHSKVAQLAGVGYRGWDYDQRCLLAIATVKNSLPAETWEVFRPQGPYALLPLTDGKACLIDYGLRDSVHKLERNPTALQAQLKQTFSPHIGEFELLKSASFPLQRKHANRYVTANSVVLLGDSAHSIHPMAGQGVNLGFADVRCLIEALKAKPQTTALKAYETTRQRENAKMMRMMDCLQIGWRSTHPLMQLTAKLSLSLASVSVIKRWLLRQAMGE